MNSEKVGTLAALVEVDMLLFYGVRLGLSRSLFGVLFFGRLW